MLLNQLGEKEKFSIIVLPKRMIAAGYEPFHYQYQTDTIDWRLRTFDQPDGSVIFLAQKQRNEIYNKTGKY